MAYTRDDDDMLDHPKWRRALKRGGDSTLLVWHRLRAWCARRLTDGVIPGDLVADIAQLDSKTRWRAFEALVEAGLLAWCGADDDSMRIRRGLAEPGPRERQGSDSLVIVGFLAHEVFEDKLRREARLLRPLAEDDSCAYCGQRSCRMTIDHVIPICLGGGNEPENLVPARAVIPRRGAELPLRPGCRC